MIELLKNGSYRDYKKVYERTKEMKKGRNAKCLRQASCLKFYLKNLISDLAKEKLGMWLHGIIHVRFPADI